MNHNFLRFYKPQAFVFLLITLSIIVFLSIFALSNKLSMAVFSIVTIALIAIDKYLWRMFPFKYLFKIPDLRGTYEGVLRYKFRDDNCTIQTGELRHLKKIHQTGSTLVIKSSTYKSDGELSSPSESIDVVVQENKDGSYKLIYTYLNDGSREQGFPPHYGTETVDFIEKGKEAFLEGDYYTNRVPIQTRGKFIDLKRVSKKTS